MQGIMTKEKSESERAAGRLISAIQKEWGLELGEPEAEQSELAMECAHELLQARNAVSMLNVLGTKSIKEFLGSNWVQSHKSIEPAIFELEIAIKNESA
jgi:hypothetical protein